MNAILQQMEKKTWVIIIVSYIGVLLLIFVWLYALRPKEENPITVVPTPTRIPTPTPFIFTTYAPPKINKKDVYKIAMIGDSMTVSLGPHGGGMSEYMNSLYKKENGSQGIIIDNYSVSSSILTVDNQITQKATRSEYTFGPLLSGDYEILLIESFGYNPLSEFGVEGGIQKQNEVLGELMWKLITQKPNMVIIFVATIAPNIDSYGSSTQPNTVAADRIKQAEERIAYIKNHIEYAKSHNIPLINIYEKSLTENGDGDKKYINQNDDIHPSFLGTEFIGLEIGKFIYDNQILPI